MQLVLSHQILSPPKSCLAWALIEYKLYTVEALGLGFSIDKTIGGQLTAGDHSRHYSPGYPEIWSHEQMVWNPRRAYSYVRTVPQYVQLECDIIGILYFCSREYDGVN